MGVDVVKQLVSVGDETLLERAVRVALKSCVGDVFVVLGFLFGQIEESLRTSFATEIGNGRITIVQNKEWKEGIASSIRAAVSFVSEYDAVLFTTADQPFVDESHLGLIVNKYRETSLSIVASRYGTPPAPGIPALFNRRMFSALSVLQGDRGAKGIILDNDSLLIDTSNASFDVDTLNDLQLCLKVIAEKVPVESGGTVNG